jgi:hypothetical protein
VPYGFEATFNMITALPPVDRNWSTAVKRSSEALFTELVDANIEMLRHTPSIHHIDIALGHLLAVSDRDAHCSRAFIEAVVKYLTQRNCRSALLCFLKRYSLNLLWPRIASRMNKGAHTSEGAYVEAIWEVVSLGMGYTQTRIPRRPYDVNFEFWVLAAINENTSAYASTTVLVKLNILSGLYWRHFEGPLVVDELLRHPLILATRTLKEERFSAGSGNITSADSLGLFRSACIEAHVDAVADFLVACSSPVVPYKAAETLSYIAFPHFSLVENFPRSSQLNLAKSVQRAIRSQITDLDQRSSGLGLVEPILAMLKRNIHNVLTDLGAGCTITDVILEAEHAAETYWG